MRSFFVPLLLALLCCGTAFAQAPDAGAPPATEAPTDTVPAAAPDTAAAGSVPVPVPAPDTDTAAVGTDPAAAGSDTSVAGAVPVPTAPSATPPVAEPTPTTPVADPAPVTPAVPVTDPEVVGMVGQLLDAAKVSQWNVVGGFLILLLIWLFNRLGLAAKIGGKYIPWVAVGTGALVAIAVGLTQGVPVGDALKLGLFDGALAVALWELIVKHFLKASPPPPAA